MANIEYTAEQAYEEMMQSLINISGHLYMLEGHFDMLVIHKKYVAQYDSTIIPRLGSLIINSQRANRQIARTFVKDDEQSKIIMFEQIGKGITAMGEMTLENRQKFMTELEQLSEKYS